ncbi:sulfotransferase family protein [uncultured Nocardioides sp.]|uniref:sulfotransferase family protein n=1 Tax=uncultured Nocardioides sp. TaxID=198441 RepID=UPI0026029DBA|nr:sulfotransferase family protein [uncultured Nocardioides sp.]
MIRLVGAGLPRTGTSSLREALRLLLGAPVYHMREAFQHPEHAAAWVAAIRGDPPDWDRFLDGYAAGVDTPFSTCWRDLAAAYPEAPVLLSHRGDAGTWYRSMETTVLAAFRHYRDGDPRDPMVPLFRSVFAGDFTDPDDPDDVMAGYERRLADVRAAIPADRLVEWQPGDGWEPLCTALGVSVPDLDFPHENSRAAYHARAEGRSERDADRRAHPLSSPST